MLRSPWNEIPHTHTSTLTHAQLTCNPRQVCGKWNNLSGHKDQAGHGDGDAVRAKLLGWHRTKLPSNIRETGREREREGEEVWESERKRDTHKHLVDCWYRKRQSRVGLNSQAGRHEGRGKEGKRSGLLYKICIHCMHSVSIPLPTAGLLPLLPLQLSPALPFSLLCFQVAFVAAKFAWLQFSFWFFLRLLWRRARHSKLCSFNLLTPCRVGQMGCIRRRLSEFFCENSSVS